MIKIILIVIGMYFGFRFMMWLPDELAYWKEKCQERRRREYINKVNRAYITGRLDSKSG